VWSAVLDRDPGELKRLEANLSREESARANRFHFARDRNHFVAARGMLRKLLGRYLDRNPADLEFSFGPQAKPFLSPANTPQGINFNVSHSLGLAVYAVAVQRNLGIDVELLRPGFAEEDIARRYFSVREINDLQSLADESRDEGFFNCWTRKEAYLKAQGMGLRMPLDSFAVSLLPGHPAEFLSGVDSCWNLVSYRPAEGYVGAVVYDGVPCTIEYFATDAFGL
jgi:4'-phosphopantetheinyl transferase